MDDESLRPALCFLHSSRDTNQLEACCCKDVVTYGMACFAWEHGFEPLPSHAHLLNGLDVSLSNSRCFAVQLMLSARHVRVQVSDRIRMQMPNCSVGYWTVTVTVRRAVTGSICLWLVHEISNIA